MTRLSGLLEWGPAQRAPFFRPWGRAVVTAALTALPFAVMPLYLDRPDVENWLGPASVAPLLLWFMHGLRVGRQGEATPAPTER